MRGLEFNNTSAPVDFVTNSSSFKPVFHSSSNRGRNSNSLLFFGSSFFRKRAEYFPERLFEKAQKGQLQ